MNETSLLLKGLPEEKLALLKEDALANTGDDASRECLVLHNMREAFFYARHCCRGKLPEDEIYSAVYTALAHAVRNYRPGTKPGIRFFAYAKPYVRGELSKLWKSKDVVKRGEHESLDVPVDPIEPGELYGAYEPDTEHTSDKKWETEEHADPEFDAIHTQEQFELLRPILKTALSDQERMVIELKYFGHLNFEEIGKHLDVTRSAIQNCHTRALRKIRAVLSRQHKLFNE